MNDKRSYSKTLYIQPTYITLIPNFEPREKTHPERIQSILTCMQCEQPVLSLFSIFDADESRYKSVCAECQSKYNLSHNLHAGLMSQKAKTRMRNAVNWLAASAKKKRVWQKSTNKSFYFRLSFLTLTLPDHGTELSDQVFKSQLLHPFLVYASKAWGMHNYIWKAEPQDNGNIHIHLTTDIFIHHKKLRKAWNSQLSKFNLLDKFKLKYGHSNPPSTEIKAVRSVKNLAGYISEYLVKDKHFKNKCTLSFRTDLHGNTRNNCDWVQDKDGLWWEVKRPIEGNIWYSSSNLSSSNKLVYEASSTDNEFWRDLIENKNLSYTDGLYYEVYYFSPKEWRKSITSTLKDLYFDHLAGIRNNWQKAPPLFHVID